MGVLGSLRYYLTGKGRKVAEASPFEFSTRGKILRSLLWGPMPRRELECSIGRPRILGRSLGELVEEGLVDWEVVEEV